LKESARKVEYMMKQTKDDILVVKQMSYEESNGKDKVEDLEG
jgi:hypothetical protein